MQKATEYEGHEVLHVRAYGSAFFTLGINIRSVFVANTVFSLFLLLSFLSFLFHLPPFLASLTCSSVTTFRVLLEDDRIKTQIPNVALTTDIIVGYPNETEAQFEETLTLYDEVEFEHAYTYIYSQRDGTPAAKMKDNVPMDVKKDRLQRLNQKV